MKSILIFLPVLVFISMSVYPQDFQITIDAEKDAFYNTLTGPNDGWLYMPPEAFNNNGTTADPGPVDAIDLSANWYSAWDDTFLYVYADVTDDFVNQTGIPDYWRNDCFDAKVDADWTGADNEVFCFAMTCKDSGEVETSLYPGIGNIRETVGGGWIVNGDSTAYNSITPQDYARKETENGYALECRVKWEWIVTNNKGPITPHQGDDIGFALSIHDNDLGASARDNSIEWAAQLLDNVWSSCTNMGYIELLADHKIKYIPESLRDPSIINPNPDMYIPAGVGVSDKTAVLRNFALSQNYPNPFNPATAISYTLQKQSEVKISVYDPLGHEVAILVDGIKPAGSNTVYFDGSNLSSGIYFYKLQAQGRSISKKMVLLK